MIAAALTALASPRWRFVGPVLLLLAAAVVGSNSLSVPLLLDDPTTIAENPSIRQLTPLSHVLLPPAHVYTAGRPLLNLSFALNYAWGGTTVTGYHVLNTVIHALAGLVLYGLIRRTLSLPRWSATLRAAATPLALAISLAWLVHPAQTASVTYLSQRAESLMGLFYLLTLYSFVRAATEENRKWGLLAVVACACGMMTKEVMATAPLLIFLYDRQFVSGTWHAAWRRHRGLYLGLAACWLLLLGLMLQSKLAARGIGFEQSLSRFDYACIETRAILHYLRISLWPEPLIFDFGPQLAVPTGFDLAWRALIIVALIVGSLLAWRRASPLGFAGLGFFLLLAPTSSFVPVAGQPIAENRLYLPLALVLAAAVIGTYTLVAKRGWCAWLLLALPLVLLAHQRNRTYQTELRIWGDTVAKLPTNSRACVLLSVMQRSAGQIDAAIATLLAGLRYIPNNAELHNNVGVFLFHANRAAEALTHLREAVRLKPDYASGQATLGRVLLETNDPAGAIPAYEAAARLDPNDSNTRNFLGVALVRAGRPAEAIPQFEAALQLRPDFADARNNLAYVRGEKR